MTDFFHFLGTIEGFRFALVLTMLFLHVPGASCPAVVDLRVLASRAKSPLPCLPDHLSTLTIYILMYARWGKTYVVSRTQPTSNRYPVDVNYCVVCFNM
ncbi:hypothetical protein EDD15DRAFT_157772 [Pisolithus albus]|nr:hypothetical protein EDD15DRAFT_157772 [Pisolithus albus]